MVSLGISTIWEGQLDAPKIIFLVAKMEIDLLQPTGKSTGWKMKLTWNVLFPQGKVGQSGRICLMISSFPNKPGLFQVLCEMTHKFKPQNQVS